MGVEVLVIGGVVTNQCVEAAVRDACDLGYRVILVEDGCAAVAPELHAASLRALNKVYCHVRSTAEVVEEIERWTT
ncbi:MAG: isochorismatase family protein [Ardenticatenaceae bacterium]|nr:isochorismatase family protein [Ardenticatenaceae bacterium]